MGKIAFTAPRVEGFNLPDGKAQAFLWDSECPGLGLRVTAGSKSYVYQSLFSGKTLRITIGDLQTYRVPEARERARELQRQIDKGIDPRLTKQATMAKATAERKRQREQSAIVRDVWDQYVKQRKPKWSANHLRDHAAMVQVAGLPRKRSALLTEAGVLTPLMSMRMAEITSEVITALMAREGRKRPARAQLALRLLKAFLRWAALEPEYKSVVDPSAITSRATEAAGKPKAKSDSLMAEQLKDWFAIVRGIQNPVISAYLQILLLTGARREELMALKWDEVNAKWRSLTLRDKDNSKGGEDGTRTIPLTPYVQHLISNLPKRGKWVFSSATSKEGRLIDPTKAHTMAVQAAGLDVTLHGLRRSFGSLSEWLDIPHGVIAQIMGHKPSATAEKHYRVRPVDMLRVHHERLEAWIIERAGMSMPSKAQADGKVLRLVV